MSENRKYAQVVYKAFHDYIVNTYPTDSSLSAEDARLIRKDKADKAARNVYDEIILRGKPMGLWVQYTGQGINTKIYVFYHPNPAAHKVW